MAVATLEKCRTPRKGFGAFAAGPISQCSTVIEYVGEILNKWEKRFVNVEGCAYT